MVSVAGVNETVFYRWHVQAYAHECKLSFTTSTKMERSSRMTIWNKDLDINHSKTTSTTSPLPKAKDWSVTPFRCLRLDIYQVSWTCFSDPMGPRSSAGLKWSRSIYRQFALKRVSLSFHVNSFEIWTNLRFLINLSLDCTGLWFQVWLNVQDVARSAGQPDPPHVAGPEVQSPLQRKGTARNALVSDRWWFYHLRESSFFHIVSR